MVKKYQDFSENTGDIGVVDLMSLSTSRGEKVPEFFQRNTSSMTCFE